MLTLVICIVFGVISDESLGDRIKSRCTSVSFNVGFQLDESVAQ